MCIIFYSEQHGTKANKKKQFLKNGQKVHAITVKRKKEKRKKGHVISTGIGQNIAKNWTYIWGSLTWKV